MQACTCISQVHLLFSKFLNRNTYPMSKTVAALCVLGFFAFISCNKKEAALPTEENDPAPKEVTKANLSGSYLVTKVEGRTTDGQRADITENWFNSYAGNCAKDDVTTFKPDESFVVQDGTMICDESTDDTGTWKLLSNTQLKIDTDTATIEAFTGNMLRIVSPVYSSPQQDIIFTYTRQ